MDVPEKQMSPKGGEPDIQEDPAVSLENGTMYPNDKHLGHGELEVIRIREGNGVLRQLRAAELWMDRKLKIEGMGAERIPESDRKPPRVVNVCTLIPDCPQVPERV